MAGGVVERPAGREQRTPLGWQAEYRVGRFVESVTVVQFTRAGEPLIIRKDGSLAVVSLGRVKLVRREELP